MSVLLSPSWQRRKWRYREVSKLFEVTQLGHGKARIIKNLLSEIHMRLRESP